MIPEHPNIQPAAAERAELESVVEALAKWPRLSHLLRYMGEKVFSGQSDQLNEYNIATEVLGRSKTVFNAADDAIARVETHRLRKRLAVFYENEGRGHAIQLTLPAGSYVPIFIQKPQEVLQVPAGLPQAAELEPHVGTGRQLRSVIRNWKYLAVITLIVVAGLGVYLYVRARGVSGGNDSGSNPTLPAVTEPQSVAVALPLRMLAGYSGPARPDSSGRVWHPDQYYTGGTTWQPAARFISGTSDPFLFEHARTGEFSYSIPLKPGIYELHLFFSTVVRANNSFFSFNISLNGRELLTGFDINVDAFGADIADEKVFRDASPDNDGFLRLGFSGATGTPTINAIEIVPGVPHAQLPIRLITQTTPLTDSQGRFWRPDNYFMNGQLSGIQPLLDSPDPDLFAAERYGHFGYAIPVDARDRYTVVLHFVEFYFGPGRPGNGGVGSRTFKVMCNGETLLDNFDVFKDHRSLHEITRTFRHLRPTAQGKLNLTFEPIVNNATISGLEVLDEAQ